MSLSSAAEARSFAETRRMLLDALDRSEQEAHDQAATLVSVAEQRAREITINADRSAALIEEQLTYLTTQLDQVRARVADIRTRLAHELQTNGSLSTSTRRAVPTDSRPEPVQGYVSTASDAGQDPPHHDPAVNDNDSLPETLRVLRAALESLNGQPPNDPGVVPPRQS